ncbi:sensor domain-containing diguanylate cyclase [Thermaerobacter marianensis]|nr:sensor domain-containing diguanylate cyclase [Thermaerobacter marianensis]
MRLDSGGTAPVGAGSVPSGTGTAGMNRPEAGWMAGVAAFLAALAAIHAVADWVEVWALAPLAPVLVARRWGWRAGGLAAAAALVTMAAVLAVMAEGPDGWRLWVAQMVVMAGLAAPAGWRRPAGKPARGRAAGDAAGATAPSGVGGDAAGDGAGHGTGPGGPGAARPAPVPEAAGPGPAASSGGGAGPVPAGSSGDGAALAASPGTPAGQPLDETELHVLYACTHALNKVTSVDDLIREFNNLLSARLGYPYLALLLVQPDGSLRLAAAPLYPEEVQGLVLAKGQGICSVVVETGQPVIVDDVTQDPRYYPGLKGARSQIAVPVLQNGKVVGVLNVESPHPAAFGRRDLRLLTAIADEVAVALERARLLERVEQQAITDPLTGLYNRTYLVERLREEGERAARYGRPLSLLFIDLDDLKVINDRLGHDAGDRVLVRVARVLREACRSVDFAARYGGDEFVVVLPETGPEGAMAVAARIQQRLAEQTSPLAAGLGASIGLAAYPAHARDWTELLRLADQAMYGAKRRGKGRVGWFGPPGQPGATAPVGEEGEP